MPRKALEERLALLEAKLRAKEQASFILFHWLPKGDEDCTGAPDAEGFAFVSPHFKVGFTGGSTQNIAKALAKLRKDPEYQKPWVSDWKPKVTPGAHETASNKEGDSEHDE